MSWRSFSEIWVVDFEFLAGGDIPVPLCYVAQNVGTGELIRHWITPDDRLPLYTMDSSTLFIAYFASAEMGCHIALNWPRPSNILDLYAEFRCITNGRKVPSGNGLIGALAYYGLGGGDADYKDMMRERILQGPPYSKEEREQILTYCAKDVELTSKLYQAMKDDIDDLQCALMRGRYMWAVAMMEHHGVPLNVEHLHTLEAQWDNIKERLIARVDKNYGVYDGTTFKSQKFLAWLNKNNIPWEMTETGIPRLDDDYMRAQAKTWPQLKPLQELRYSMSQLRLANIQVGKDGRNRTLLSPFQSRTGRNQPSSTRFIFGNAVWLRNLISPTDGMAIAYLDYEQQEIAIAAALSHDDELLRAYQTGDPYVAFAKSAGAIPLNGTKETHPEIREKFKVCMLALNYGMSAEGFANRSGMSLVEARAMFRSHKLTYHKYWDWISAFVDKGMLSGRVRTRRLGWYCYTQGLTRRSLQNWPMQANGSDILRIACILCLEAGIRVVAPVHDALLIEATTGEIGPAISLAQRLMGDASEHVLGIRIRTDSKVWNYPEHYTDKRGTAMWDNVWAAIRESSAGGQ